MGRIRIRARDVIVFALALVLGALIGFIAGELHAVSLFTKLGVRILEAKNINLTINADEIARGIFQYQNHIS